MTVSLESDEDAHFLAVLDLVRRRPGMWLDSLGVQSLNSFLSGVTASRLVVGAPRSFLVRDTPDFGDWIAVREGVRHSPGCGWAEAIQSNAASPEKELEAFFAHLDEFVQAHGIDRNVAESCGGPRD